MERPFGRGWRPKYTLLVVCLAAASAGCSFRQAPPEHARQVNLRPGEVKVVLLHGGGHPRLEVSADQDIDLALVYADDPATDPDKVTSTGRVPKRYHGREFKWSYTGIEKDMKLLLRSADGVTLTVRYTEPLPE